jgi:DNA-binding Lrp family transcriptional regulator
MKQKDIMELLADIKDQRTKGAITTAEAADKAGISETTMRARVRKLVKAGLVAHVKKDVTGMDGVVRPVNAWVVK